MPLCVQIRECWLHLRTTMRAKVARSAAHPYEDRDRTHRSRWAQAQRSFEFHAKSPTLFYFILNIPSTGLSGEFSSIKYGCVGAHNSRFLPPAGDTKFDIKL